MPQPGKKLSPEQVNSQITAYSGGTAASFLDTAFGQWDNRVEVLTKLPHLDKADYILINGRTVSELLNEQFEPKFQEIKRKKGLYESSRAVQYGFFRINEGKEIINQMISAALAKGDRVEAFLPDKVTGKIQDTPTRLTLTGYEPAGPLARPAQLSRWKRFWGKLGFYKQEREQYRQATESYEAQQKPWKKVKFCNRVTQALMGTNVGQMASYMEEVKKYAPDMLQDMTTNFPEAGGDPSKLYYANGFSPARGSFASIAMLHLASQTDPKTGQLLYTNEELFDQSSPKMQEARAKAMKEVYDHYKSGGLIRKAEEQEKGAKVPYQPKPEDAEQARMDRDWLCELQYRGSEILAKRIDQQAKTLDFNNPNLDSQAGYRIFSLLSDTAFDQSQDIENNNERLDELHGEGTSRNLRGIVGGCSQIARKVYLSLVAQKNLMNGYVGEGLYPVTRQLTDVLESQMYQQYIGQSLLKNPDQSLVQLMGEDALMLSSNVANEATYDKEVIDPKRGMPKLMKNTVNLTNERKRDPAAFADQVASGVLENRLKLTKFDMKPAAKEPVAFKVVDAATAEREMQHRQRQQARTGVRPN